MDNKKQYYNNLKPGDTSIESRLGAKILMSDDLTINASLRPEYLGQLRQEYYQGNVDPSLDKNTSIVYMGNKQVTLDQQGNVTQLSLGVQQSTNTVIAQPGVNSGLPTTETGEKPIIESISPSKVKKGDIITIKGKNLQNITRVIINDETSALFTEKGPDTLEVTIPDLGNEDISNVNIKIVNPFGLDERNTLNYISTPIVQDQLPGKDPEEVLYETDNDDEGAEEINPPTLPTIGGGNRVIAAPPPTGGGGGGGGGGRGRVGDGNAGRAGFTGSNYTIVERNKAITALNGNTNIIAKSTNPVNAARLTQLAEQEIALWNNGGYRENKASESATTGIEKQLWDALLKYADGNAGMARQLRSNAVPWSAYFISWLVNQVDSTFPKGANGASHYKYNIENRSNLWSLYPLPNSRDNLARDIKIKIEVGDVLTNPRSGDYYFSHGDVVYKIEGKKAYLVGGNLGDSVKKFTIDLDDNGYFTNIGTSKLIIIKRK
jgi:hypothetical protein